MYDIPALRAKMLVHLGERAKDYPEALEKRFPRILAKLVEVWGKPAADTYLDSLMVSDRPSRQGFPLEVASEILRLSMITARCRFRSPRRRKAGRGSSAVISTISPNGVRAGEITG
jgi:hypothetical protein